MNILNIFYQNVRGLKTKLTELYTKSLCSNSSCICLTETWLDETVLDSELFCNNFIVYRCDRSVYNSEKSRGGGVLIAAEKSISSIKITLKYSTVEMICVKLSSNGQSCYVFNVYLPPDALLAKYEACIDNITSVLDDAAPCEQFIIVGDFNIPEINWTPTCDEKLNFMVPFNTTSEKAKYFTESISFLSMFQVNFTSNSLNRILDLVLTDSPDDIEFDICDPMLKEDIYHPALSFSINFAFAESQDTDTYIRFNFKKCDFLSLNQYLQNMEWNNVYNNTDLNVALDEFYKIMVGSFEKFVPIIKYKSDKRLDSWFTPELKKLKNRKNALYKKLKRKFDTAINNEYNVLKNELLAKTRLAYNEHILSVKMSFLTDPKIFWKYIDNKRKLDSYPKIMQLNQEKSDNHSKICDMFASFFKSVYKNDDLSSNSNVRNGNVHNFPTIFPPVILTSDVLHAISKAKCSYSAGPDGIPSCILKNCGGALVNVLCHLFNASLSSKCFPECWKSSFIIPLFKKGARHDIKNYRGIAKLSSIPKLFESIITDDLSFKVKSVISPFQHGFCKGRSTVTNLLTLTSLISDGFKHKCQTDVGYFDFSKAFDQLNHRILISKLSNYGISNCYIEWIMQYLSQRVQSVCFNNCISRSIDVVSGVPQGSHLGPLLFVLFINDLPDCIKYSHVLLYADDAKIFKRINSIQDCQHLQNDFNGLIEWCNNNDLQLNFSKCNVLSFCRKRELLEFNYSLGVNGIKRVHQFNDLGVIFDPKITFINHVDSISARASSRLGMIKRWTRELNDPFVAKCLYVSLVRSILEYASPVWNPFYDSHINKLESVQRQFLLFALSTFNWGNRWELPKYEHRLLLLDMNTLYDRRTLSNLTLMGKILNGQIDCSFLLSKLDFKCPIRRIRSYQFLNVNSSHYNYLKFEPFNMICQQFNDHYFLFDFNYNTNSFKKNIILYYKTKMKN